MITSITFTTSIKEPLYSYEPIHFVRSYEALRNNLRQIEYLPFTENLKNNSTIYKISKYRRHVTVASVQIQSLPNPRNSTDDITTNARLFLERAEKYISQASVQHNASLVLLQELFLGPYFCQSQNAQLFALAEPLDSYNPIVQYMRNIARRYAVVLPLSIFERKHNAYYNSVLMIDSDGSIVGKYRKSHIPDGTGYQEKFYFTPGDTGFQVFKTSIGNIGVGICWDQWFPEVARILTLKGADILLYPTAIGSEPHNEKYNSLHHWQRVIQGHSAANMIPVVVSNRYGTEILRNTQGKEEQRIHFYGKSFITDIKGQIVKESEDGIYDIISYSFDFDQLLSDRAAWGLFRDRRTDLYDLMKTKDGQTNITTFA